MIERHELNRHWWNDLTPAHVSSKFYDVPRFLAGDTSLDEIELAAFDTVRNPGVRRESRDSRLLQGTLPELPR